MMKTSALADAAQLRLQNAQTSAPIDVEEEFARIDRSLAELLNALAPLAQEKPRVSRFNAERPTSSLNLPEPPELPAPAQTPAAPAEPGVDVTAPTYGNAAGGAYGGAPAAANNSVPAYGVPGGWGAAPTPPAAPPQPAEPMPNPAAVADAAAGMAGASPVLAAIHLLHPAAPAPATPAATSASTDVAPVELPTLEAVRPRSHGETGWVGNSLRRLSQYSPELAGRAILSLLPLQGDVITDEVTYDLVVTGELCHAVSVEKDETSIHRISIPRPLGGIDARIEARIEALGAVPFRAPLRTLRKSDAFRINGRNRKKALSALKAVALAPLTLSEIWAAGVKLSDELLLGIVAAGINPEWTIGHRFTIAVKIEDPAFGEPENLFVRVNDGAAVTLSRGLPLDLPSATLTCTSSELANVLLGKNVGRRATLAGERAPVMLLQGWVARLESGRG